MTDALRKLRKNLRISESTEIELTFGYRSVVIGTIWRISKCRYGYRVKNTRNYSSAMEGVSSQGKAATFDQALLLIFAYRRNRPLTQHNRFKPKSKSFVKGLYPHQQEVVDAVRHSNYHEQGFMAGLIYEGMRDAMRFAGWRKTEVVDAVLLEEPNTITITDYEVK